MKEGKMNVVFGGQAGSEAKGKLSAYLVDKFDIRVLAGSLSPNAGHTVVKDGIKTVTHHIPVGVAGARRDKKAIVVIGPSSVIRVESFLKEVKELERVGMDSLFLAVDNRAAVITDDQIQSEVREMVSMGSTAQGVGEARAAKVMRRGTMVGEIEEMGMYAVDNTTDIVAGLMENGRTVVYEMGQGFDLCLEHGIHPVFCTSRICNPMMAFAEMGIPIKYAGDTYAVMRTYPIRVNNRTGSSGPYPSEELTWETIRERCGAPHDITEITTTTRLTRRVFEFSWRQAVRMVRICNPTYLCLQFANYLNWQDYGKRSRKDLSTETRDFVRRMEKELKVPVAYIGTGPDHEDMIDTGVDR